MLRKALAACYASANLHVLKELHPPQIQSTHEFFHPSQKSDRLSSEYGGPHDAGTTHTGSGMLPRVLGPKST